MKTPLILTAIISVILAACSTGREYIQPAMESTRAQAMPLQRSERFQATEPVARWWRQFEDELLTKLVEEALQHNYDIRIAIFNLQEARAFLSEKRLDRFPTVEVDGGIARQQLSNEGPFGPLDNRTFKQLRRRF